MIFSPSVIAMGRVPASAASCDVHDGIVGRGAHQDSEIPLLNGREQIDRRPTAYVCQRFACQLPTTDPQQLARQLQGLQSIID